ncbi:MAG: ATP-dependent Clp protease ATP-binding subunit [Clostridia bacterium]|nr:ATP-dependent Clp protease ATP-binding subunit [Clostridia bacterium]
MKTTICSRCKKNIAVLFVTKIENGVTTQEGLCLKCAKELGLKPVEDIIARMGLSDDEIENINNDMMESLGSAEDIADLITSGGEDNTSEDGTRNTATFPFLDKLFGAHGSDGLPANPPPPPPKRDGSGEKNQKAPKHKFLDQFCTNLNEKAKAGKIDNIVGRATEIERVIQILNRRQKSNPCLIGEPGVGKTAIAEGLAARIVEGNVPIKLREKEVWQLDMTAVVAGTQFRGQFESRMKGLIEEIRRLGNIILAVDEVHNLVGAGDSEGSMNAANILKPALSKGEVQVIGATTFTEYRKYIEKDAALERRFQPVTVAEPSVAESVEILKGIRKYYEEYHTVTISDEICRRAVAMSERYITDRYLPDKAIDLLDEAASAVNLRNTALIELSDIQHQLDAIETDREALNDDHTTEAYEKLAELKSRELRLNERKAQLATYRPAVEEGDLAHVIELWTKIPASKVQKAESQQIIGLDTRLKSHIIGQDEAVEAVAAAIRRNRAGISYKRKPISFIFAGPTGVGKTELVKQLALDMFDTPEALIRLDMSEFMEKHAVSRIIGSPPGYVGYDEAGQLTEKIRRKPYSVVLFDEIEKAHPDVLNILLQILDDGRITDAHGRVVSFENAIVIMTTNAGSASSSSLGFGRTVSEQNKEKTMRALQDFLRPEFINRVDDIITFRSLDESDFKEITKLMLRELAEVLFDRGIRLVWDDKLVSYLSGKGYSVKFGARNLRRLIQKEIEDKAASLILENEDGSLDEISLSSDGETVIIQ